MESKLMPCPFCGGDDCELTETKQQVNYKLRASYFCGCPDCGVYTDYCETKEEAIERWNRRVSDDDHK